MSYPTFSSSREVPWTFSRFDDHGEPYDDEVTLTVDYSVEYGVLTVSRVWEGEVELHDPLLDADLEDWLVGEGAADDE